MLVQEGEPLVAVALVWPQGRGQPGRIRRRFRRGQVPQRRGGADPLRHLPLGRPDVLDLGEQVVLIPGQSELVAGLLG